MPEPHVIQMGDVWEEWRGQWVKVKPWMSHANAARIQAVSFAARATPDSAEALAHAVTERTVLFAELQVLEWHLIDLNGEEIERSREGVMGDATPPDLMEQVALAIDAYYEALRPPAFRRNDNAN